MQSPGRLPAHIDTTPRLQTDWKFTDEHNTGHIDLPRMNKGGLNALFFSIYMSGTVTGPKAVSDSLERIAAVHKLAEDLPDNVALCVSADQVRKAHKQGKIAALMGMEGGHMINNSLPVPAGMEDVTHLPQITEALFRKGYAESDLRKILGENTLRLLSEVERAYRCRCEPPSDSAPLNCIRERIRS